MMKFHKFWPTNSDMTCVCVYIYMCVCVWARACVRNPRSKLTVGKAHAMLEVTFYGPCIEDGHVAILWKTWPLFYFNFFWVLMCTTKAHLRKSWPIICSNSRKRVLKFDTLACWIHPSIQASLPIYLIGKYFSSHVYC